MLFLSATAKRSGCVIQRGTNVSCTALRSTATSCLIFSSPPSGNKRPILTKHYFKDFLKIDIIISAIACTVVFPVRFPR